MNKPATMNSITTEIALNHKLQLSDLIGKRKTQDFVAARQEAMWTIRQVKIPNGEPRYSLSQIGRHFGSSHTNVIHACKQHLKRTIHAF